MFDPIEDEAGDMDMMWIPGKLESFLNSEVHVAAFKEQGGAAELIFKQLFGNSIDDLKKADMASEGWLYFAAVCKAIEKREAQYLNALDAMSILKHQAFSVMKSTHDQAVLELTPSQCGEVWQDEHWTHDVAMKIVKAKKPKKDSKKKK